MHASILTYNARCCASEHDSTSNILNFLLDALNYKESLSRDICRLVFWNSKLSFFFFVDIGQMSFNLVVITHIYIEVR